MTNGEVLIGFVIVAIVFGVVIYKLIDCYEKDMIKRISKNDSNMRNIDN